VRYRVEVQNWDVEGLKGEVIKFKVVIDQTDSIHVVVLKSIQPC
jgi:hypothetical protein